MQEGFHHFKNAKKRAPCHRLTAKRLKFKLWGGGPAQAYKPIRHPPSPLYELMWVYNNINPFVMDSQPYSLRLSFSGYEPVTSCMNRHLVRQCCHCKGKYPKDEINIAEEDLVFMVTNFFI